MQPVIRAILAIAVTLFVLPELGIGSIIFEPGKKAKYVAPGEEEMSGDAAGSCTKSDRRRKKGATLNVQSGRTEPGQTPPQRRLGSDGPLSRCPVAGTDP